MVFPNTQYHMSIDDCPYLSVERASLTFRVCTLQDYA